MDEFAQVNHRSQLNMNLQIKPYAFRIVLLCLGIFASLEPSVAQNWVVKLSPHRYSLSTLASTSLQITLDRKIKPVSIRNSTMLVTGSQSGRVPGLISYDSISNRLTFSPAKDFVAGEAVTAVLSRTLVDLNGDTIPSSVVWNFLIRTQSAARSFVSHADVIGPASITSQTLSDLDRDGKADLIFTTPDSLVIWKSSDNGSFDRRNAYFLDGYLLTVATGDFDNDGDIDLAVGRKHRSMIAFLQNAGNADFVLVKDMAAAPCASLASSDFDGDGNLDLAAAQLSGSIVLLLKGNGDCSFTFVDTIQNSAAIRQIRAEDFTRDGRVDLVLLPTGASSSTLCTNRGSFSFTTSPYLYFYFAPTEIFPGDFDNDGYLDVLAFRRDHTSLQIEKGELSGSYVGPYTVQMPFSVTVYLKEVTCGDVDGDGDLDIVLAATTYNGSHVVTVLVNTGGLQFSGGQQWSPATAAQTLLAGDVTGDGRVDIAMSFGATQIMFFRNLEPFPRAVFSTDTLKFGSVLVGNSRSLSLRIANMGTAALHISHLQTSNPAFTTSIPSLTIGEGDSSACAVVFSPGDYRASCDSLLISTDDPNTSSKRILLIGESSIVRSVQPAPFSVDSHDSVMIRMKFARPIAVSGILDSVLNVRGSLYGMYAGTCSYDDEKHALCFVPTQPFRPGERVTVTMRQGIETVNGEPLLPYTWEFTIRPHTGTGLFSYSQSAEIGDIYGDAVAADFNHDDLPDLAFTSHAYGTVVIALNSGGMTFTRKTYSAGSTPAALAAADLDNDGNFDLAVLNADAKTVTILKGSSTGSFAVAGTIEIAATASSIACGDVDGDGQPDLVVGCFYPYIVRVFRNAGLLAFALDQEIPLTYSASSVTLCDLDNDGDLDLAVASALAQTVGLIERTHDHVFSPRSIIKLNGEPIRLLGEDFDSDGDADLAVLCKSTDAISFLRNNGLFNLSITATNYAVGIAVAFTTGDFDTDGDLDIVAISSDPYYTYLTNSGNLQFARSTILLPYDRLFSVAAADFDRDGDIDLALTSGYSRVLTLCTNKNLVPAIHLLSTFYDFQTVKVDSTSESTLMITNIGLGQPLSISSIASTDSAVTVQPTSGIVPAGDTLVVVITFRPGSARRYRNNIVIVSNDPVNSSVSFHVEGNGDQVAGVHPLPYCSTASDTASLAITFAIDLDATTLSDSTVRVGGSWSGKHASVRLDFDAASRTLSYTPRVPFLRGEEVTLVLTSGLRILHDSMSFIPHISSYRIQPNPSTGIFQSRTQIQVPEGPISIAGGDFDGDGDIDLAVLSQGTAQVTFERNDGNWNFSPVAQIPAGFGPKSLLAGDYDGDGLPDLVATDIASKLLFFRNNGGWDFSALPLAVPGYLEFITQADFDGDGDIDWAAASSSSAGAWDIIENKGGFAFAVQSLPNALTVRSVMSADLDGDGDIDVGFGSHILRNDGNFLFTLVPQTLPASPAACWDMDGDQRIDIAAGFYSEGTSLFRNLGKLSFAAPVLATPEYISDAAIADDHGDGLPDLTFLLTGANIVRRYRNHGNMSFVPDSSISLPGTGRDCFRGDFDGDGDIDIAVVTDVVTLCENRSPYSEIAMSRSRHNFLSVPKDSAASTTFFVANHGTLPLHVDTAFTSDSAFSVSPHAGTVQPKDSLRFTVTFRPGEMTIYADSISVLSADADQSRLTFHVWGRTAQMIVDSVSPMRNAPGADVQAITVQFHQDVVPSSLNSTTIQSYGSLSGMRQTSITYDIPTKTLTLLPIRRFIDGETVTITITNRILLEDGSPVLAPFTLSFTTRVHNGTASFTRPARIPVGDIPQYMCAADIDNDGLADLIVSNVSSQSLSVIRSISGSFPVAASTIATGPGPHEVVAGDLDRDGTMDVVVGLSTGIQVMRNEGNLRFSPHAVSLNRTPSGLTLGDYDGDGDLDIAMGCRTDNTVTLLRNDGELNFVPLILPFSVPGPYQLSSGDFDNDGDIDIIAAKIDGHNFLLIRNDERFDFSPITLPDVSSYVVAMGVADFNNDGLLDVAASNANARSVSILLNAGGLTFRSIAQPGIQSDARSLATADFNGDGKPDFAAAPVNSVMGSVYLNDNLSFTQATAFLVESGAPGMAAFDFSGDGTMDIAFVNEGLSSINVLLNFDKKNYLLSTRALQFGEVPLSTSLTKSLTLLYNGDDTLRIDSIYSTGHSFTFRLDKSVVVPGDSARILVTFHPQSIGAVTDTLYILVEDGTTRSVLLVGMGVSPNAVTTLGWDIPREYSLGQNYPNPFNPSTLIHFGLPERSHVVMSVFTLLGQKVADILDADFAAGYYCTQWKAMVCSGVYIYSMRAASAETPGKTFQQSEKMLLMR